MNLPSYVSGRIRQLTAGAAMACCLVIGQRYEPLPARIVPTEMHPDPTDDPYNGIGGQNYGRFAVPMDGDGA